VLVDYKTDSVTEENYIGKLVNRYKDQLMYYKEAVNIIFGKYPDKTLLYCVPLAKTVPVYAKLKK
jgi:ATP-dependent exoDNAse (exonuclease V) beta subunit